MDETGSCCTPSDQHRHIDSERIHLLYRQAFWGILASLINGLLLIFLLRDLIGHARLAAWLVFVFGIAATRCLLVYNFKRLAPPPQQLPRWRNYHIITLAASGLVWGSVPIFLFPLQSVAHQFLIAAILCGMVAGAAMAFAVVLRAFLAFAVPILMALALRFLSVSGELHTAMAVIALLYLLFSFSIAKNLRRVRIELLLLKDELSQRVARRTKALKDANRQLQAEIQERARMQERLRQERDRLEIITASMGVELAVVTRDYKIAWGNQVLRKRLGEVEDKNCHEIYSRNPETCRDCGAHKIFKYNEQEIVQEQERRDEQGNPAWSQIITTPIRNAEGEVTAALEMVIPTTRLKQVEQERRHMAKQLEEARKFEAIATLAGGIAHQFNNALAVIFGNLELLDQSDDANGGVRERIAPIQASAARMSRLTDQLLAYAKGGKYKTQWMNMRLFVGEALEIAHHSLRPGIELIGEIEPVLPEVRMDVTQMQMVLSAILSNAAEAIEAEGRIHVECRAVSLDPFTASRLEGLQAGLHAQLRIIDTGIGMAAATLARIFEPFFSTKFQGRGLAMAAVFGIIKNHGGHIQVESEPDQGTRVTLHLPAREAAAGTMPAASPGRAAGGSGVTILLIEDEEMVREINRTLLERLGHAVIEAASGRRAMDEIAARSVDLALLDIKLPDMDSTELFNFIKAHCPQCKVIVCSGYALESPATGSSIEARADAVLQKPFSMHALAAKINALTGLNGHAFR